MGGSVSTPLPVLGWLRVIGVVVRRRLVSAVCRRGWWHVGWAVRRVFKGRVSGKDPRRKGGFSMICFLFNAFSQLICKKRFQIRLRSKEARIVLFVE
jgi:hypothetical protein